MKLRKEDFLESLLHQIKQVKSDFKKRMKDKFVSFDLKLNDSRIFNRYILNRYRLRSADSRNK